jgi:hypothetical protein
MLTKIKIYFLVKTSIIPFKYMHNKSNLLRTVSHIYTYDIIFYN